MSRTPASIRRGQRVVDHRFVVHRQQLLAHAARDRVKTRAMAARQNDPLRRVHRGVRQFTHTFMPVHVPAVAQSRDYSCADTTADVRRTTRQWRRFQLRTPSARSNRVHRAYAMHRSHTVDRARGDPARIAIRSSSSLLGRCRASAATERRIAFTTARFVCSHAAADVVSTSGHACFEHPNEPAHVIVDMQPVADLQAVAVDRNGLTAAALSESSAVSVFPGTGTGRSCSNSSSRAPAGDTSRTMLARGDQIRPWMPNKVSSGCTGYLP